MSFRGVVHALVGSVLLAALVGGSAGCSSLGGCHSSGCGVGLGRPLLSCFRPHTNSCAEALPVTTGTSSHVISGQACDSCQPCEPTCCFTLRNWPFSFPRLFNRCETCSDSVVYLAPQAAPCTDAKPAEKKEEPKSDAPKKAEPTKEAPKPMLPPTKPQPVPAAPAKKPMEENAFEGQPELSVGVTSPVRRYVGKIVDQTLVVFNRGKAPATGVELIQVLPQELRVEQASAGGVIQDSEVKWALGTIPAESSKTVTVQTRGTAVAAEVKTYATVTAKEGVTASATSALQIHGKAALMLKVFDLADPVPVGNDLDYLVQVTNQGTVPALDLKVRIECPDEIQPVAFTNAPELIARGQSIQIPAFDLAACGTKMFRLRVHAVKAGDVRFRVHLEGKDLKTPILEEESTRLYSVK